MYYVYAPTPHKECKHDALQTCTCQKEEGQRVSRRGKEGRDKDMKKRN